VLGSMESFVTFRISGLGPRAASTRDLVPFGELEGGDVVVRCPPGSGTSLNDQLVWLWAGLKHRRRAIATLQAAGATLSCEYMAHGPIVIKPNGAEFLHLLGVELAIV